jgi:two-component system phosphate regulon sensor histidine kinase PhoR
MKLWLKISMICTAVLLLTVSACSVLLLAASRSKILSLATENAKQEQANLEHSFDQMMTLYGKTDLGQLEERSLAVYCFKQFKAETSVLVSNGETLYSNLVFDPQQYLPLTQQTSQQVHFANIGGTNVIIVGSRIGVSSLSEKYDIYFVQDISGVYASIEQMIWEFGAVSLVCILVGVGLVILLVSYTTRPVAKLGESVKRIARGEYANRVTVESKDEIGELARGFNLMAGAVQAHVEELREVAQRQQLFIGALTHEFKTPLTSVIGHAETLLYTKMPPDVAENSLLYIHEECKRLERLTQKMLKLVTLQEEIELREESVAQLLEAVGESVAETLSMRGVSLEISCEADTFPMDRDLMTSLLVNLVDNASKASAAGQAVTLRAYARTIEVTDRGIGIPADEIARITEPFYRVDKSRSRKMGGVGLGLALVQKIADAHGAQLAIESAPGCGTSVRVIFPDNKTFTKP